MEPSGDAGFGWALRTCGRKRGAKFFAHDFDDLYSAVWSQDRFPQIAEQLEKHLRRNGDWERVALLVRG